MYKQIRLLVTAGMLATAALGAARLTSEEGARPHRTRLAVSAGHACTIVDDGTVKCWGDNNGHSLGNPADSFPALSPIPAVGVKSMVSVVTGQFHSCGLQINGLVSCWGLNAWVNLGTLEFAPEGTEVTVAGVANAVSISAGDLHTCAVRADGTVWCWGDDTFGKLGNATIPTSPSLPVQVTGVSGAVSVAAGSNHTCALLFDGTVTCWGGTFFGQGGSGSTQITPLLPAVPTFRLSPSNTVRAVDVVAGEDFTCALLSDGTVSCWGQNSSGQLGNGTFTDSAVPVVIPGLTNVVGIGAGWNHACAILANGAVKCWGSNKFLELGTPPGISTSVVPVNVPLTIPAVEIMGGEHSTCAELITGQIECWGANGFGQHGDGTAKGEGFGFVSGVLGTSAARRVSAGEQFTCAHRANGSAACWGAGTLGQLGDGANASSSTPEPVFGLTQTAAISAGKGSHACAVDAAGRALCWGDNSRGQLGNGSLTASSQPVFVSAGGALFAGISAGDGHTCALAVGGRAMCWGAGDRGQLGNGNKTDSSVPVLVAGVYNVIAVSAGNGFGCALVVDGTVHCWGDDSAFQLGDGFQNQSPFPTEVFGVTNAVALASGASHSCAVTAAGSLLCWGSNSRGQIGDNSTTPAQAATQVMGINNVVSVSAGAFFTCATRLGGAACWGSNDSGELSAIDTASHLTPTTVFSGTHGLQGVVQMAAGTGFKRSLISGGVFPEEQTCAVLVDGTLRCWGNNAQGEVGNGNTTNQPQPVLVNSFVANADASTGVTASFPNSQITN
jgi:alpha-tubulin suppressor-like RCC1 family protein